MAEVLKLSTISQMRKETARRPTSSTEFKIDIEPKLCRSIFLAAKAKANQKNKEQKRDAEITRRGRSNTIGGGRLAHVNGIEKTTQLQLDALDLREPQSAKTVGYSPVMRAYGSILKSFDPTPKRTDKDGSPSLSINTANFESYEANQVVKEWQKKLRSCVTPNSKSPTSASACLSDQEISRGLKVCYGEGYSRSLRPGERAVLINHIKELTSENWQASNQLKLTQPLLIILLKRCRMNYLARNPACVKQIYSLWRTAHVKDSSKVVHSFTDDPVLAKLEDNDSLAHKKFVPLSSLYRKHLKFI